MKKLLFIVIVCALVLAACGAPTHSGNGHEFVIKGRITDVGSQSIRIDLLEQIEAHGYAVDCMDDSGGSHKVHDNCDCHGLWSGRKKYGHVYDYQGNEISLDQVTISDCVIMTGAIRKDQDGKYSHNRPVYERADLVPCG